MESRQDASSLPVTESSSASKTTPHEPSVPEDKIFRASGDCLCTTCGKAYRDHPMTRKLLAWDGEPYLHELCDGSLVKL